MSQEKWDSTTRRWKDDKRLARSIGLFMVDEVHTLNDKPRGQRATFFQRKATHMGTVNYFPHLFTLDFVYRLHIIRFDAGSSHLPNEGSKSYRGLTTRLTNELVLSVGLKFATQSNMAYE